MSDLKIVFRKMGRDWIYPVINIVGLSVALAAALLIYSYVVKEWKTDRFQEKGDNLYRAVEYSEDGGWSSLTTGLLAPTAQKEVPGILGYVRVMQSDQFLVKSESGSGDVCNSKCIFADVSFFDLFTFPILSGVLEQNLPGQVVISQRAAEKFFPGEDPIGKTIRIKDSNNEKDVGGDYPVVALMADFPETSSLQADFVVDFSAIQDVFSDWSCHGLQSFLYLDKDTDVKALEVAMSEMKDRNRPFQREVREAIWLQPLTDIYLGSDRIENDDLPHGSAKLNWLLGGIAMLILVLAFSNYLMIRTALLRKDMAGFAVRLCYGVESRSLCNELWSEVVIHLVLACVPAFLMTYWAFPYFTEVITLGHSSVFQLSLPEGVAFVVLVLLFVGMTGFVLSSDVLRRLNRNGVIHSIQEVPGRFDIKKMLAVLQLSVFAALLFCSVVLIRQMGFIREKRLGFQTENILNFNWPAFYDGMGMVTAGLMELSGVVSVSNGEVLPLSDRYISSLHLPDDPNRKVGAYNLTVDSNYLATLGIRLLEGRNINTTGYPTDHRAIRDESPGYPLDILVNEQFVKQMGLEDPVGCIMAFQGQSFYRISGVVEDFHFFPLYRRIEPVWLDYNIYSTMTSSLIVRYRPGYREAVVDFMRKRTEERFPNLSFRYTEYNYSDFYSQDVALARLVNFFTLVAIFIGGMGVLAFSIFLAESKQREVAIRKVNGATEWQIIGLLVFGFVVKVLVSCAIGVPVAYYLMNRWLQGFAYKTLLDGWVFGWVVAVCLVVVVLITGWQVWRTARINPVDSLKKE